MPGFKPLYITNPTAPNDVYEIWVSDSPKPGYKYRVTALWGNLLTGKRKTRTTDTKTYKETIAQIDDECAIARRNGYVESDVSYIPKEEREIDMDGNVIEFMTAPAANTGVQAPAPRRRVTI